MQGAIRTSVLNLCHEYIMNQRQRHTPLQRHALVSHELAATTTGKELHAIDMSGTTAQHAGMVHDTVT